MSQPSATSGATMQAPDAPYTRLRGRWQHAARLGTLGLALLSIILSFMMIPANLTFLATPCAEGSCPLTPQQAQALGLLGMTPDGYATFTVILLFVGSIPSLLLAALLFWRRSDDWLALLVALQLANISDSFSGAAGIWQIPAAVMHMCSLVLFYLSFLLFPSGRFVPRWEGWFVIGWLVYQIALFSLSDNTLPNWLAALLYAIFYANLLFSQIYRYRRVSSQVERQQTKWVVFGLIIFVLADIAYWQPYTFIPALSQPDSLYAPLLYPFLQLIRLFLPLAVGVAILRYRLWDIDTIINKALVYGSLTGLLGALYAGLIIGLESLADALFGKSAQQPVVLVVSTLAIAALFYPLRRRIQGLIDRRFYRRKYDAEKALAAFSAALRQETDLEQIREELLGIVRETMQPTEVSLWLRQPEQHRQPHRTKEL